MTTKDLSKPHSSRWVGGAETWRHEEKHGKVERNGEAQSGAERHGDGQRCRTSGPPSICGRH